MKNIFLGFIIFAVLAVTNPGTAAHRTAVEEEIKTAASQELSAEALVLPIIIDAITAPMIYQVISRENYLVFSLTIFTKKNADRGYTIGIGILGNVFIFDDFINEASAKLSP